MRILFLDAYFEPEQIAFSHLENDLLEGLVQAGHEVEIVCPTPTRCVSVEVAKEYKKKKSEVLYNGRVNVTRFSAPQEGRNPIIRALRYFWCNLRTYQIGKKMKNIDVIFANSTPPTQGMLSVLVAQKLSKKNNRKVPFVFSLQDIFPDSLVNAKLTTKESPIWKIGRKMENYTYKGADRIIVISEGFKRNIIEKGVPEEKIVVVPNWVDTSSVYPVAREDNILFDRYHLDRDKFYICYSGNIGHSQNMRMLLNAAKELKTEAPDVRFVIIGGGAAKEDVAAAIRVEGIDNVMMFPLQPYEDIAHVFSLGDAGLIISKSGIGGSSVPSKTWSIMAAGRPVICSFDDCSALSELIREIGCGVPAQAEESTANFKKAIFTLLNDRERNAEIGSRGRRYLMEHLDKGKCVGMYIEAMKHEVR